MPKGFENYSGFSQQPKPDPETMEFSDVHVEVDSHQELHKAEERYKEVLEQISVLNENGGVIRHPLRYWELKQAAELALEEIKLARMHVANETHH